MEILPIMAFQRLPRKPQNKSWEYALAQCYIQLIASCHQDVTLGDFNSFNSGTLWHILFSCRRETCSDLPVALSVHPAFRELHLPSCHSILSIAREILQPRNTQNGELIWKTGGLNEDLFIGKRSVFFVNELYGQEEWMSNLTRPSNPRPTKDSNALIIFEGQEH
jgi:hypothetical protein